MPHSAVRDDLQNLADAVDRAAAQRPTQSALIIARPGGDDVIVSWAELNAQVNAVARGLLRLNRPAGKARVAVALPNVPEFAAAVFGALRAGLTAVPINPGYTGRELRHVMADSASSVIIASAEVLAELASVRDQLPALAHTFAVSSGPVSDARPFAELTTPVAPGADGAQPVTATAGGEDLAVLLYTSGTAGAPKGAMLSHRSLIANHHQVAKVEPAIVRPTDVVLLALPLFHAFGLNAGLGAIAWHGATGVLVERFEPDSSLDIIARHRVSVVSGVPQMYAAWTALPDLRSRLASVRLAISGAAELDRTMAGRFLDLTGHEIFEGYGLTETAPVVTTALASTTAKSGSIGRPLPGIEIRLVGGDGTQLARLTSAGLIEAELNDDQADDEDDDAADEPGTDAGEIVVRGENLFSGYWPDGSGGPDPDGWWATGDIAYADGDGDLFLVDRLGELIIVSGFNVYPHEVELVLAGLPGVAETAVVGQPDPHTGQAVKAYVVRAVGSEPVSHEDLLAHCARNLARFKWPTTIEFVSELPHSATGKVRKGTLRGRA